MPRDGTTPTVQTVTAKLLELAEFMDDRAVRDAFVKAGNFLARDDTLAAIRLEPRAYKEVMPSLRWCPRGR